MQIIGVARNTRDGKVLQNKRAFIKFQSFIYLSIIIPLIMKDVIIPES